jgi:hypothetical protein
MTAVALGRTPALQARSVTPRAPSFAFGFQRLQQFRGICFSLEVTREASNPWGFGTVKNQVFHKFFRLAVHAHEAGTSDRFIQQPASDAP